MKRQVLIIALLSLLFLPTILAGSSDTLDSEIQKLTHYAKEYEIGNIDYVQLMIHMSSAREGLNEILGVTNRDMGGVVKQEQIEKILGEPFEDTKWVWVEGEDRDVKMDSPVPIWKKIVFDGKKIQIRMEAFPSIFTKKKFKDDFEDRKFKDDIEEGSIIYRLHFNTEFKRPQEQLDIDSKIEEIKSLAEEFSTNPTNANAKTLAKQSVTAERVFQNYFMQGQGKCEDVMKSIFGSENQRQTQKILSNEFTFYEGESFEAVMRLEMCEECEWNYINLNMWLEGKIKHPEENSEIKHRDFKGMTDSEFRSEIKRILESIKRDLESGEYGKAMASFRTLNMINNEWGQSSNNAWEEVRKIFDDKINSMSEEERYAFDQSYGWIKQEQEQRKMVKEIQDAKFEERKAFYLDLFSEYDMKEFYVTQTDFEKRLVEEFRENGEEICSNNQDDNEDGQVDCEDSQCGGKVCGAGTQTITSGNTTTEAQVDFYCIQSACQAREIINKSTEPVCGNHICEEGEADTEAQNGTCQSDCSFAECPAHEAIECNGKVVFEGEDEKGCQLPPVCIEETETCDTTEDCAQPSCGASECTRMEPEDEKGICRVTELTGCTAECESWEQEIEICNNQKILTKICEDGQWKETGSKCEGVSDPSCVKCGNGCITQEESTVASCEQSTEDFECKAQNGACVLIKQDYPEPISMPIEPIVSHECVVANDCGGEDDICSNGKCIQIPKVIRVEEEEKSKEDEKPEEEKQEEPEEQEQSQQQEEKQEEEPQEESSSEFGIVGLSKAILSNFRITGNVIAEASDSPPVDSPEPTFPNEDSSSSSEDSSSEDSSQDNKESNTENKDFEDQPRDDFEDQGPRDDYNGDFEDRTKDDYEEEERDDFKDDRDEWEERGNKEREQHEEENKERCAKDCTRPCVDKCTRESCGEGAECDIEAEIKTCEKSCQPQDGCIEKCTSGDPDWWKEFQDEDANKQEKGVFQVGGGCRKEQGQENGHIWFGGWGDPFERIQGLKEQYYSDGEADWCKHDLDNLIKQRKEFEKGFNQEFAQWFFEKYLPSSAEDWEQAQSGIYELYWNNVDTQRQLAERMDCLNKNDVQEVMDINLINIEYETEFGKLEYWEEIQTIKMEWMEEEVTIISPYMKVWIFPSEEFIKYEMQTSMEKGEFPGPSEEKAERENEEGLTEEEKTAIRENENIIEIIEEVIGEYNGNANINFQIVDAEEIVFNMHVQINKEDLMVIKPMLPKEAPTPDITIQMDFMKLYDMINFEEEDMRGAELESPPWDEQPRRGAVKGVTDGVKMYFKVRSLINSAEVTPASAEGDAKDLIWAFLNIMGDKEDDREMEMQNKEGEEDKNIEKPGITGEVIKPNFKF